MKEYYLGADASKGYADFVILNQHKEIIEDNFQLDDTFEGHQKLYQVLSGLLMENSQVSIYAGIESSGGYEQNWFVMLNKLQGDFPIYTARVNPFGVNHHSKASLNRNITDKISARNIAEYLITFRNKIRFGHHDYFDGLRRHWKLVELLSKQRIQLLNQLESLIYIAQPQLVKYCRDVISRWTLLLLIKYPTAQQLARARITAVAKIPYITDRKASLIVADAKQTVASANDNITGELIRSTVKQIIQITDTIQCQLDSISKNCQLPEVELLKTFPGIGDYSAIGLILEIGAIERFSSTKKLASYFGLHPSYRISGDGVHCVRMSKRGRKQVRRILFIVAMAAIVHNPHIERLYNRLLKRGMPKMAAIGVLMHKIMRMIYGMLKHNCPYDPTIDQFNQEKSFSNDQVSQLIVDRRYQPGCLDAPISKRQLRKRKEREESQNEESIKNEIITPVHSEILN